MEQDPLNGMINPRQRVELTTRPRVRRFRGPMFDGYLADNETAVIRYEDAATYKLMSI